MPKKTIRSHLPDLEVSSLVQATIAKELKDQVRTQMKRDGITFKDLITASFMTYLEESKKNESGRKVQSR